ncbi:MAG: hypothetical protein SXQ77_05555, partial [Halobacteria archaeon]|nr:hypothetical protein [Halobacteria archaeon]
SEKVVQTELPHEEYERLRKIAEEEDVSLKDALREAAKEYSDRHMKYDSDDPLFNVEPGKGKETDAEKTDEYLADVIDENDEER